MAAPLRATVTGSGARLPELRIRFCDSSNTADLPTIESPTRTRIGALERTTSETSSSRPNRLIVLFEQKTSLTTLAQSPASMLRFVEAIA